MPSPTGNLQSSPEGTSTYWAGHPTAGMRGTGPKSPYPKKTQSRRKKGVTNPKQMASESLGFESVRQTARISHRQTAARGSADGISLSGDDASLRLGRPSGRPRFLQILYEL